MFFFIKRFNGSHGAIRYPLFFIILIVLFSMYSDQTYHYDQKLSRLSKAINKLTFKGKVPAGVIIKKSDIPVDNSRYTIEKLLHDFTLSKREYNVINVKSFSVIILKREGSLVTYKVDFISLYSYALSFMKELKKEFKLARINKYFIGSMRKHYVKFSLIFQRPSVISNRIK